MGKKKTSPSRLQALRFTWPQSTGLNFILLLIVTAIFFRDVLLHPSLMLWGNDIVRAHSTYKQVQWHSFWDWHTFPLWDPTVFCGKSIVGDPLPALLSPLAFLFWISPSPILFGFYMWIVVTVSCWGTFLLARKLDCDALSSLLAAVAFSLSGKTGAHLFAGHIELLSTALGLPWILWASEKVFRQRNLPSVLILGIVMTIVASMGSVQLMYLHIAFAGAYMFVRGLLANPAGTIKGRLQPFLLFLAGLFCFLLLGAAWWFPIVRQTLLLSARTGSSSYAFATMDSAEWRHFMQFLWPFSGVPLPKPLTSDAQMQFFWEFANYPGVVTLCLALAAVVVLRKEPVAWVLGGLGLLAALLALGNHGPLYWLAYHVVPGFSLFRVPARLFFYTDFAAALLAAMVLSRVNASDSARWAIAAVPCVLLEVALIVPLGLRDSPLQASAGKWIPLLILLPLAPAAVFWAWQSIPQGLWRSLCVVLLMAELLYVWDPLLKVVNPDQALPSNSVAEFLAEEHKSEEFRVLDTAGLLEQQLAAKYGLEIITGYHPGIYARHLDMYRKIWRHDESDIVEMMTHSPRDISCSTIFDLMNVRYVVTAEQLVSPEYVETYRTPPDEFEAPRYVYLRKSALPRAFLVGAVEQSPLGLTILDALCSIDPRKTCLVDDNPVAGNVEFQELSIQRRSPGDVQIEFETQGPAVAIISQSWHPDWRATDNGAPVKVLRVNYGQVGVAVEAGKHRIRVWYYPWDFYVGCGVSSMTWLLVGLILCTHVVRKNFDRMTGVHRSDAHEAARLRDSGQWSR